MANLQNRDELMASSGNHRAKGRFASAQEVVGFQVLAARVRIVDLELDVLAQLEAVIHHDLGLPLGIVRVLKNGKTP